MHRFILSAIVIAGFVLTTYADDTASPVLLSQDKNATTVTVQMTDSATIALKGNPTTGYSWFLESISGNAVTSTCGMTFATNSDRTGLLGASGTFSCKLTATHPGTSTVSCAYYRPWEKTKKRKTYTITIVVPAAKKEPARTSNDQEKLYVPKELLVGFKKGVNAEKRKAVIATINGAAIKKEMINGTIALISLPDSISVSNAIKKLKANQSVKYAEPNMIIRLDRK